MGSRQLVVAVETTGALGASWPLLFTEYVEKIIRAFVEESSTQTNASTPGMMAMVSFNSHANQALFQQSPWTSSADVFLGWLNSLNFKCGGFDDVAVAEALAEALWMCCPGPKLPPVTHQRHCLLIAASKPCCISTPVVRPLVLINAKGQREYQTQQWWSADAEAVSKAFPACQVSLSVIAPRQLASLRSIYNGARRNPRAAESGVEVSEQYPQHLILISEDFSEGKRAIRGANTAVATNPTAPSSSASGQVSILAGTGKLLTAQGPVTSGTAGSRVSTMVAGTFDTNANIFPTANTNLVSPTGGLGSNQNPLLQAGVGPIPLSGANQAQPNPFGISAVAANTNPMAPSSSVSGQATILAGTGNLLTAQGPVTSGTAGMNTGSGLSTVVGGTLNTNAYIHPTANTNLVSPTGGLGSNQFGLSALPLQPGAGPIVGGAHGTIADMNPTANTNLESPAGGLGSNQFISTPLQPGVGPIPVSGASQAQPIPFGVSVGTGAVATSGVNAGVYAAVNVMPPTSGLPQAMQSVPPLGPPLALVTPPQQPSGAPKFAKVWEGYLTAPKGPRNNSEILRICKLEAYRRTSASERLAADWLPTMQIVRIISQENMSKEYREIPAFVLFRPLTQHDFLFQMAQKKWCAIIRLPSQTLLLTSTNKLDRLQGLLFQGTPT